MANPVASLLDHVIQKNENILKVIEQNQDIRERYERDQRKYEAQTKDNIRAVEDRIESLLAMMFDNQQYPLKQEGKWRWLDVVSGRPVPYQYLRRAGQTEVPLMIKNLRRLQLTNFASLSRSKRFGAQVGISLRWLDESYEPSPTEEARRLWWEKTIQSRVFFPPSEPNPNLLKFLGVAYEDFFDLDDITIAIETDGLDRPQSLVIEDPTLWYPTISAIKPEQPSIYSDLAFPEVHTPEIHKAEYAYVKRVRNQVVEGRTRERLFKLHFFTRSSWQHARRGYSIMEQAIRTTAIILNAVTYNSSHFTNDRLPPGLLLLTGGFSSTLQIEKLKKIFWAMMQGAHNSRRFPIMGVPQGGDGKWISMHGSNREMEFYTGMTFFISIVCALSGTQPAELGLPSFRDAMKGKSLNEESQDGLWRQSQDNGLKTFINHIEFGLNTPGQDNRNVFERMTGLPVKIAFDGLAAEDIEKVTADDMRRLQVDTSVNEIRARRKLPPATFMVKLAEGLEVNLYDFPSIGNGNIAAFLRAEQQQTQQLEQAQFQTQMQQQAEQAQAEQAQAEPTETEGTEEDEELTARDRELLQQYSPR